MNQEVKIPELVVYQCKNPNHKPAVAEKGGQMLCSDCVNEFLARNVGMMEEVRPEPKLVDPTEANETPGFGSEGFVPGGAE